MRVFRLTVPVFLLHYRAITIGSIGVASDPSLEKTQYLPTGSGSKNTGSGSELLYENYDWVLGSKYVQI